MIVDKIVAQKQREVQRKKRTVHLAELESRAAGRAPPLDLIAALGAPGVQLIAEIKRASPSRGLLRPGLDAVELTATYAGNGAAAISVLTDGPFFQGDLDDLDNVRRTLGPARPLLRKDFIVDPYQVYESYAYGADAVLLIVSVLPDDLLAELLDLTHRLGMAALVEVHDGAELRRIAPLSPPLIGVNNRDLRTFRVDLGTFGRLRPLLPPRAVAVAESGVGTAGDVRRLAGMGADAVLVGEALVTADDVAAKVRELVDGGRQ